MIEIASITESGRFKHRDTEKAKERLQKKSTINAAFQIFVEKKIEPVSMGEIAELAGQDARHYSIIIRRISWSSDRVCRQMEEYLDALDANIRWNPLEIFRRSTGHLHADSCDMYQS